MLYVKLIVCLFYFSSQFLHGKVIEATEIISLRTLSIFLLFSLLFALCLLLYNKIFKYAQKHGSVFLGFEN